MKDIKIINKSDSPLIMQNTCCCSPVNNTCCPDIKQAVKNPIWISGEINTPSGKIQQISTELTGKERIEHFRARISNSFRMNYSVEPGLYAAGNPDENSDIFVSANYKMSFDILRKELFGINAWVLVLDTKGINVWCASGKGTFGTEELTSRIQRSGLERLVNHRRIIVPQLGAVGINSGEVKTKTGFRVYFGPVRACDIKKYIADGYKATQEMRTVKFNIRDRLILTPMEMNPAFNKLLKYAVLILLIFGLKPEGIIFKDALINGSPFIFAGLLSLFCGAFITPVFLPFIPFRSFAVKGWIAGIILLSIFLYLTDTIIISHISLLIFALLLFPLLSSYIALQFTGATTYTGMSGVRKELKIVLPLYIGGLIASSILLIFYKLAEWGIV